MGRALRALDPESGIGWSAPRRSTHFRIPIPDFRLYVSSEPMRASRTCLAAVALVAAQCAAALDPARAIEQYRHTWYQEQLPQNTVLDIVQRRDGSMWFATYNGLARHSGAEFTAIDRRNAPALESAATTALLEDADGTLWIGSLNGGLYAERGGRPIEKAELPVESVFALAQAPDRALWAATNAGVLRIAGGKHTLFSEAQRVPRVPLRALAADADGNVWVATDGRGVLRIRDGEVAQFGTADGLPSATTFSLANDRSGRLWVGTLAGIARFDGARFVRDPLAAKLEHARIYALLGDRDDNLWIAAEDVGLCRLGAGRLACDADVGGLSHDVVRSMLEDREGNLWIGATASGLHRISDSKLVTVVGPLGSNSVRAVFEDRDGVIWAGTDGAGLARVVDARLEAYARNAELPSAFIRALRGTDDGTLWLGSIAGLTRIEPGGRIATLGTADGLPGAIVFAIEPARAGGLWIGTSVGVARLIDGTVEAIAATGPRDTRALREDHGGRLWIGQRSGLQCLADGAADHCGTDGLPNTSVFAFLEDADGAMWIGTSNGLVRVVNGRVARYTERDGMFDDVVFTVLDDGAGNLWLSSNRGIARVARADLEAFDRTGRLLQPTVYGKSDGMLSHQANGASQSPGWRSRDGRLWIATARGVVVAAPAKIRRNETVPPVAVESMLVDGRTYAAGDVGSVGVVPDKLEFHYAAMSYVAPEAVHYRYRLEGYDRDFVDAGTRRVAYYTNLPPGAYAFVVQAANNDGVWNRAGARLAFSIAPHWYETRVFRVLAAFLAIAVLVAAYRVRLWRLRSNERALQQAVEESTRALKKANAELKRLANLDGLTRIANRAAFDTALERLWAEHRAHSAPLAMLICDIDAFKAFNDTYGHPAGDAALMRFAQTLAAQMRSENDVAARWGGEEFALLLAHCDLEQARVVAARVLDAVRALAIPHRASKVAAWLTTSIGVAACVPDSSSSPAHLIAAADQALYRAKDAGRDRVVAAQGTARNALRA